MVFFLNVKRFALWAVCELSEWLENQTLILPQLCCIALERKGISI
jgi:hypothetical protein